VQSNANLARKLKDSFTLHVIIRDFTRKAQQVVNILLDNSLKTINNYKKLL